MSEPNTANVIAGPGLLYVAPLGTALPTFGIHGEYPVTWPSGWVQVGYTDAGIDVTYTPSVKGIMVDEVTAPVLDVLTEEKFHIAAHLAEATLSNLANAISACTFTPEAGGDGLLQISIGALPLTYVMVGVQGPAPGTAKARVILLPKAICNSSVAFKIQRKDKVVFPVQFEARQVSGSNLVTLYDLLVNAS